MPSDTLLTSGDIDTLGHVGLSGGDPSAAAAELVEAVEQGRLSDQADTAYALTLAAELTAHDGDLTSAQALAARAVEADRAHLSSGYGYAGAFHAELLMKLGRHGDALAELAALRPLLRTDPDAACYVSDVLQGAGYPAIAEEWLTTALDEVLAHQAESAGGRSDPAHARGATVVFSLLRERHRVRRDLHLPRDAHDDLADRLQAAVNDALHEDEDDAAETVLFWPREEFDRLVLRWPALTGTYGATWDGHRTALERELTQRSEARPASSALRAGMVDELVRYADRNDRDPADPQTHHDHLADRETYGPDTMWPPGRNQPCWCRSGLKYKKCCLPRSRP